MLPLDTFVDDFAGRMDVVGAPDKIEPVQAEVQAKINAAEGRVREIHLYLRGAEGERLPLMAAPWHRRSGSPAGVP